MPDNSAKYLFLVSSSYGHLFPAIRLAHVLQRRGDDVLFVTARENQPLLDLYGIKCVALDNRPNPFLSTYDWYHPEVGLHHYESIEPVVAEYRPDAIIATPLVMPAFALAETCSVPLVVLGYCEYLFPSPGDSRSDKQWRLDSITSHYNALRALLHLPSVEADPAASPLKGSKYLIRSIPAFTAQEGLPPAVDFVGGLFWDAQYINYELDRFVANARAVERPLFFLQIGRLFQEKELWGALIELLGRLPVSFIVDIGRADYMSDHTNFPDNFYLHPFIPLSHVKDELTGVICGGQTTSVISAIYYGKPVLGVPNSADGAEVTQRVVRNEIGAGWFRPNDVTEANFLEFMDDIERGRFTPRLQSLQEEFCFYDQEAVLYERIVS